MSWKTKTLPVVFGLIVLSGSTASRGEESRDPSHFTYARLYCAPDGNTHFQDVTVDLRKTDFAPPAPPIHIGATLQLRARSSEDLTPAGALGTWKTASTILRPQRNSASSCKGSFPSPRPTVRRGGFLPAACFDWKTPRPARGTSPSWATSPDS